MRILSITQTSQVGPTVCNIFGTQNIPGMSFSVVSGRVYWLKIVIHSASSDANAGPAYLFSAPSMTSVIRRTAVATGAAGTSRLLWNSALNFTTAMGGTLASTFSGNAFTTIDTMFVPSANGTVQLQAQAVSSNTDTITVLNGYGLVFSDVDWGLKTADQA